MGYRNELRAGCKELGVFIQLKLSRLIAGNDFDHSSRILCDKLPGHDIRMMFKDGYYYLITRLEPGFNISVSHKIYGLGRTAYENYLLGRACTDEIPYGVPCGFIGIRRPCSQRMGSPVDVGVLVREIVASPVDDHLGPLGCRTVIKPYEGITVYPLIKYGKVTSYLRKRLASDPYGIIP